MKTHSTTDTNIYFTWEPGVNKKATKTLRGNKQKIKAVRALLAKDVEALRVLWLLTKFADMDHGSGIVETAYVNWPTEVSYISPGEFGRATDRLLKAGLVKRVHSYQYDDDLIFYQLPFNYTPDRFEIVEAVRDTARASHLSNN